jgi:hypothetical protein
VASRLGNAAVALGLTTAWALAGGEPLGRRIAEQLAKGKR